MARVIDVNVQVQWPNELVAKPLTVEMGGIDRTLGASFQWSSHLWDANNAALPNGRPNPDVEVVAGSAEEPTVAVGVPLDPDLLLTDHSTWVTVISRGDGACPAGLRRVGHAIRDAAVLLSELTTTIVGGVKGGRRTVRTFTPEAASVLLRVLHYVIRRLNDPAFVLMARRAGIRLCVDGDQPLHAIATGAADDSGPSGHTGRRLMHGSFFGPLAETEWSEGSPYFDARERYALELIAAAHADIVDVCLSEVAVQQQPPGLAVLEAAEETLDFLGIDRVNCQHPNAYAAVEQYEAFVEALPSPSTAPADEALDPVAAMAAYHEDNAAAVRDAFTTLLKAPVAASVADHAAAGEHAQGSPDGFLRHERVAITWDGYSFVLSIAVFANPLGDLAATFAQTALPTVQHPAQFLYATLEDANSVDPSYVASVKEDGLRCYEALGAHQLSDHDKSIGVLDFLAERPKKDAATPGVAPPNLLGFAFVERTCDECVDTRVYVARSPLVTGSVFAQRSNQSITKPHGMSQAQFEADLFGQRRLFNETFGRCLWRAVQAMSDGAAEGLFESDELVFHFARVKLDTHASSSAGGGGGGGGGGHDGHHHHQQGTPSASAPTASGALPQAQRYEVVWDGDEVPATSPHGRILNVPQGASRPTARMGEIFCLYAYDATAGPPAARAEAATKWVASQLLSAE